MRPRLGLLVPLAQPPKLNSNWIQTKEKKLIDQKERFAVHLLTLIFLFAKLWFQTLKLNKNDQK